MRDTKMLESIRAMEVILREAEKAYTNQDFQRLSGLSQEVPEGYNLVVLTAFEHSGPCVCILPTKELTDLQGRFRCVDPVQPSVSSACDERQETSSEPDGSSSEAGIPSSMESKPEDGRGNL